jgi:hypothetical protein
MSDVPSDTTAWARLDQALTRLHASGHQLSLWWRDDDAVIATPQLDQLLDLAQRYHLPLALAVVPGMAETSLAQRLNHLSADRPEVVILQHGWKHQNHAAGGAKKCEYPASRDPDVCLAELSQGQTRLRNLFGSRLLPVLVPPWNRFASGLIPSLATHGFIGLSGGPSGFPGNGVTPGSNTPGSNEMAPLRQVHTTIDPIDWASRRNPASNGTGNGTVSNGIGIRPLAAILDDIIIPLEAALAPQTLAPPFPKTAVPQILMSQTLGILTHHLVHGAALWSFLDQLFLRLTRHPAVRFVSARSLFRQD